MNLYPGSAREFRLWLLAVALAAASVPAAAGGLDHRVAYDDSGIWKRSNQTALLNTLIVGEIGGALWEGGDTRLGRTFWQAIDSSVIAGGSAEVLKYAFRRERPAETSNPNQWFKSGGHYSFPSGEVAGVASIVTPFVLEYGSDYPAVYALELLPIYDSIARVKTWGHWQSDVLAGFALGTAAGWYAHSRETPLVLSVMPHGIFVGLKKSF